MSKQIALVYSDYYKEIVEHLLEGARRRIVSLGYDLGGEYRVSGALELVGGVKILSDRGVFAGYVVLGCVLRGQTTHYDTVSNESARGLMNLTLAGIAVGNGILTCETYEQALARATLDGKDKGGEAVEGCVSLLRLQNGG